MQLNNTKYTKIKIDEVTTTWVNNYKEKLHNEELTKFNNVIKYIRNIHPNSNSHIIQRPFIEVIIYAAHIIDKLDLLNDTVLATLCIYSYKYDKNWKENIKDIAGSSVLNIIEGFNQLQSIYRSITIQNTNKTNKQELKQEIETIRKMILAVVDDFRVVLIILALRTSTLLFFNLSSTSFFKKRIAKETLYIFAPLANRLGIWQLQWQLEDLALKHYKPEAYIKISKQMNEDRTKILEYIQNFNNILRNELEKKYVKLEIAGRPKHIYSVYKKMRKKKLSFYDLYDIRAVRIIVSTISDCYKILGIVHRLWEPIANEFEDYISHPKPNNYRSLHTVVVGPEDKSVEIQIRTFEMHKFAEYGVAAHWKYKEDGKYNADYDRKIAKLRYILQNRKKSELIDNNNISSIFKNELFKDNIYTLTPHGKIVCLPSGSTPVDFACALYNLTENRCRTAKINGQIVPLSTKLESGQRIEICTTKDDNLSIKCCINVMKPFRKYEKHFC
ncbi:unnamed protein product [Diabrotica balteata]|uniref:Putative GTP diphosphokinase RSH1, chloroplastic n=1 Tax=Diabrotica balteata TaxID=107213 RepID=A0A9N9T0K2_DIABA|nr:unnamed protein product [Diabrotica balteata]